MKAFYKIGLLMFGWVLISALLQSCEKADDEFVHTVNTISQMICKASHTSGEYRGEITEYNKEGKEVTDVAKEDIEGGYGLIIFKVPISLKDEVDLTSIYLVATVTYDEFITPSLAGKHDITGDGIIISVKSGIGTVRNYRVRGEYE